VSVCVCVYRQCVYRREDVQYVCKLPACLRVFLDLLFYSEHHLDEKMYSV
jgi:hypothetical protein